MFTLANDLKAFLRRHAGVGRQVADASEEQKSDLVRQLQHERQRRRRAESKLKKRRDGKAAPTATGQTHALPEPDIIIDRHQVFRSLISPLKPGKMLDLGTGPGTASLAAAELGWEVTAVDARTVRMPDPETEKDRSRAELVRSVRWVEADVREFPIRSGEYDLICILGILHHLKVDDHVELLKRCSNTLTLLDARIATEIVDTDGPYEGRYRHEPGETREERDQVPTAAWGNEISFHHTEESLLRLVRDCGYMKVMPVKPSHDAKKRFYLCLPFPSK